MNGARWLLAGLCLGFSGAACEARAADTPSGLRHMIAHQGAQSAVHRLATAPGYRWSSVLRHVQTGEKDWLLVALSLKPGTDAATAEDLSAAVATAMLSSPTNVLRLMLPAYDLERLCSVPLIEPTPAALAAYQARANTALDGVSSPDLAPEVRQCRGLLQRH